MKYLLIQVQNYKNPSEELIKVVNFSHLIDSNALAQLQDSGDNYINIRVTPQKDIKVFWEEFSKVFLQDEFLANNSIVICPLVHTEVTDDFDYYLLYSFDKEEELDQFED